MTKGDGDDRHTSRLERSTDPRAVRTRAALRQGLLDLLKDHAFEDITPAAIAKAAGMSRAAFYLHHASKEAMLDDLTKKEVGQLYAQALSVLDEMGSRVASLAFCEYIARHRGLWSALLNGGANAAVRAEMLLLSRNVAAKRAVPGDRLPAELSTAIATSSILEIAAWWLRQPDDIPVEEIADLMVALVHDPIARVSTSTKLKFR